MGVAIVRLEACVNLFILLIWLYDDIRASADS
jgi:hypothetical protein